MIDLRSPWERSNHPYSWPAVTVVHAPMADDDRVMGIFERFEAGSLSSEELENWWDLAGVFDSPTEQLPSIRLVFEVLLDAGDDDGVLFHCRGGKDRTGVIAALILDLLGVDAGAIQADFLLSNESGSTRLRSVDEETIKRLAAENEWSEMAVAALRGVRAEWLSELIRSIEARWGSVESYVADEVGIGSRGVERLRRFYLEPT